MPVRCIFWKFQKIDNYFMVVKLVPLESGWFRLALIRYIYEIERSKHNITKRTHFSVNMNC